MLCSLLHTMKDRELRIVVINALALLLQVYSASGITINRRHTLQKLMSSSLASSLYPKPSLAINTDTTTANTNNLDNIDWNAPKYLGLNAERMCDGINDSIRETSWLVTGLGNPSYFSDGFVYKSTDEEEDGANVRIQGYERYCRWINNNRYSVDTKPQCDLICCSVTAPSTITALWRLDYAASSSNRRSSGDDIKLSSKVYLSTFTTSKDQDGLVVSQNDKVLIAKNAPSGDELRARCNWYTCIPESIL